jgi:hypothetical protein
VQTGIVLSGATPTVNAVLGVARWRSRSRRGRRARGRPQRGVSSVVSNEDILSCRRGAVTDLIVLAGAAVQTGATARGVPGGVYISVAGGLPGGVAYTLDGAEHNNPQSNAGLPMPFPDALQEFQVATSGLSADNGVKSGASVNAVTKSGTTQFHGAFEFLRDRRFNARALAEFGPDGKQLDDGLPEPVRRHDWRTHHATSSSSSPATQHHPASGRRATFRTCRRPRCSRATSRRSRRRVHPEADQPARPFVNNRIDPARLSPAARKSPRCCPDHGSRGEVQWSAAQAGTFMNRSCGSTTSDQQPVDLAGICFTRTTPSVRVER